MPYREPCKGPIGTSVGDADPPDRPVRFEGLARRVPPLLRQQAFRRYWTGQTVSLLGDQISAVALPFVALLVLHADAAQLGLLAALPWLPSLLFALHAGAWVDRHAHRRATMIGADLGRAALLLSVPVSYAFGVLTIGQLYAVAFTVGVLSVLFTVCNPGVFVGLVADDRYIDGNSLVYGSRALSFVAGPSVGGLLVELLTAPYAVIADALSFLGSAYFLARIRPHEAPAAAAGRGSLTAGLRFIRRSGIIRSSLAAISVVNFFNFGYQALFMFYATRSLHVRPASLGLVLGMGAVGGVLGAMIVKPLAIRFGVGRVNTVGALVFTAPLMLVPLAGGGEPVVLLLLFTAEFVSGLGLMLLDISSASMYAAVIPDHLRSRVSGAFQAVNYGTRPLGAVVGGLVGTAIGARPTLWIATVGGLCGFLLLLVSPVPGYRMATRPGTDGPAI